MGKMKKVIMGLLISAVVLLSVFLIINNNTQDNHGNMAEDNMSNEDMLDSNDMSENDMDDSNDMSEDDMTESDDITESDDMTESDGMTDDPMMTNEGKMAPMFDLKDIDGNRVSLKELKGEKVYVKFWASWCSICLAGLEELDMLTVEETEFEVITIVSPNYNGEKNTEKFKAWYDKQGHDNLIVLLDEDGDFTREFGVRGYPTSAFIGSDGILVHLFPGHLENDMIKAEFMEIY